MSIVKQIIKTLQNIKKPQNIKNNNIIEKDSLFTKLWKNVNKKLKELLEKQKKEQVLKKKDKEKSLEKEKKKESPANSSVEPVNNLEGIYKIIQQYEELIEKDFFATILSAKAYLREWRSELAQMISQQHSIPNSHLETLSLNLTEICELYQQSNVILNNFINKCSEYSETVKDINRILSPQQKLSEVTISLDKLKRNLKSKQKILDYNNDNDFKFLNNYLKEREFAHSKSHISLSK